MSNKYCIELGYKVRNHLISLGLEQSREFNDDTKTKITYLAKSYREMLNILGLKSQEFYQTPNRVARMFAEEIFYGLNYSNFPTCALYENKFKYQGKLTQKNINIMSICEHHFLPFIGEAEISFIHNNNNIIGLCRINSICDFFSRRPQIQERMTAQIFETLKFILGTEDVSVKIKAKHTCVSFRGTNSKDSETYTEIVGGVFKQN